MANAKKKWTKTRKKGGAFGGVVVREEGTGRERTLLSPSQKGAKYSQELRERYRYQKMASLRLMRMVPFRSATRSVRIVPVILTARGTMRGSSESGILHTGARSNKIPPGNRG